MSHPLHRPQQLAACLAMLAGLFVPPALAADGPARVIVRFKADSAPGRQQALALRAQHPHQAQTLGTQLGLTLEDGIAIDGRTQVVKATGIGAQQLADRLAATPDVESARVDHRAYALAAPNDPLYPNGISGTPSSGQWYLRAPDSVVRAAINAEGAWDLTTGKSSVVVAVLDTGVRKDHPDLAGKLLPGYDFISDVATANDGNGRDSDPSDPGDWVSSADEAKSDFSGCEVRDSIWHGTQTAGLIGAATNNGIGIAGTGRDVSVLPVRVLGKCGGFDSDIQAGMRWAAGLDVPGVPDNPNPARVLNMSLGSDAKCTSDYQAVVDELLAHGVLVVAAAGNSGLATGQPANCRGVVGVAGLRHIGTKVGYSSLGSQVSIAAPAGNCVNDAGTCQYSLITTSNSGSRGPQSNIYTDGENTTLGTSFASPLVAGTVGLMLSLRPNLSPTQITTLLKQTARAFPTTGAGAGVAACRASTSLQQDNECYCTTSTCGAGMLDAAAAVTAATKAIADFSTSPADPSEGASVTLDASASQAALGASIKSYFWAITSGGVIGKLASDSGQTTTLQTSGAGTIGVRLTITDNKGRTTSTSRTISVAANASDNSNDSGGGAGSPAWLLLLAASLAALASGRRRA